MGKLKKSGFGGKLLQSMLKNSMKKRKKKDGDKRKLLASTSTASELSPVISTPARPEPSTPSPNTNSTPNGSISSAKARTKKANLVRIRSGLVVSAKKALGNIGKARRRRDMPTTTTPNPQPRQQTIQPTHSTGPRPSPLAAQVEVGTDLPIYEAKSRLIQRIRHSEVPHKVRVFQPTQAQEDYCFSTMSKINSILGHKFPPPPFITTPVDRNRGHKESDDVWKPLRNHKYGECSEILSTELILLREFIERKGPQLRLEKAMMLTNGIVKLAKRWKRNNFYEELMNFKDGFSKEQSTETSTSETDIRLPSYQWLQWTIYILLRDAVLLAKIKIECENTMKFWLGMIASSHHWGDSLIMSSIIARIWQLSSAMLEELNAKTYPLLLQLNTVIEPVADFVSWPKKETCWTIPDSKTDLVTFLASLDMPFQPANLNRTLSTIVQKDNGWLLRVLDDIGNHNSDTDDTQFVSMNADGGQSMGLRVTNIKVEVDDDDYGVPLNVPEQNSIDLVEVKSEPEDEIMDGEFRQDHEDQPNTPHEKEDINPDSSNSAGAKKKRLKTNMATKQLGEFREYWMKFFDTVPFQLESTAGRKKLNHVLREHKAAPDNAFGVELSAKYAKLKFKLKELKKVVGKFSFQKSQDFMYSDFHDQCMDICEEAKTFLQEVKFKRKQKATVTRTKMRSSNPAKAQQTVQKAKAPLKTKKTKLKTAKIKKKNKQKKAG